MENKKRPGGDRNENSEDRQNKPERKGRDQRLSGERRPRVIRDDQKKNSERPFRRESSDQGRRPADDREKRSGSYERKERTERKPYNSDRPEKRERSFDKPERRFGEDESKPRPERKQYSSNRLKKSPGSFDKPIKRSENDERKPRPYRSEEPEKRGRTFNKPEKRFGDESKPRPYKSEEPEKPRRSFDKPEKRFGDESKPRPYRSERLEKTERSFDRPEKKFDRDDRSGPSFYKPEKKERGEYQERRPYKQRKTEFRGKPARREKAEDDGTIRLNKYIANAGICSRREADKLIEAGAISVNGVPVTELGTKVLPTDKIKYGDQSLSREKPRYVLLNKPKGFITTTDDPENRKTVMNLISKACKERIYPIGRLDRNTTGLLLFTNDGDMAKKLAHPRFGIKKIYHVVLDRNLTKTDMKKIADGITLDDGMIRVDAIEYITEAKDKKEVGIELHSGKNRVVRRIFETLEYKVVRLDRVVYAGLTKKNLPRGEWRFLEQKEINMLKIIS